MPADSGADGQQTNQNKANELDKAQKWFIENKPYAYSNIYAQKRAKAENNRLLAKGEWDGTGFLYRLNIQKERVRANLAGTNLDYSIKGSNLESSLNGDMQDSDKLKLHISLGKDTLVFTRF